MNDVVDLAARRRKQRTVSTKDERRPRMIEKLDGNRCELWNRLQDACVKAIKLAELEKSGVRDGDGCWVGGDVLGDLFTGLPAVVSRLEEAYRLDWEQQVGIAKTPHPRRSQHYCVMPDDAHVHFMAADDEIPW